MKRARQHFEVNGEKIKHVDSTCARSSCSGDRFLVEYLRLSPALGAGLFQRSCIRTPIVRQGSLNSIHMPIQSAEQCPLMLHSISRTMKRIILLPCDLLNSHVGRSSPRHERAQNLGERMHEAREKTKKRAHLSMLSNGNRRRTKFGSFVALRLARSFSICGAAHSCSQINSSSRAVFRFEPRPADRDDANSDTAIRAARQRPFVCTANGTGEEAILSEPMFLIDAVTPYRSKYLAYLWLPRSICVRRALFPSQC